MESFFMVFIGGIAIFLSMVGWGVVIEKLLSRTVLDWGLRAALGLAFAIVIGGVLNLFGKISKINLEVFLGVGLLSLIIFLLFTRTGQKAYIWAKNQKKINIFLILTVVAIVSVRFAVSVAFNDFHGTDDYHAYLAFPVKMIETGSLGQDPFSERRITSSLGGKYFLDALVLTFGTEKNLHLIDGGVSFIIFLLLVRALLMAYNIPFLPTWLILLLASLAPSPSGNITSFFSASALFLAMYWVYGFFDLTSVRNWKKWIIIALLATGICALKSTFIPVCAIFVVLYTLFRFLKAQKLSICILELAFIGGMVIIMLAPWMLQMHQSSGTWLYPVFGKGYHGSVYGVLRHNLEFNLYSLLRLVSEFLKAMPLFLSLVILVVLLSRSKNKFSITNNYSLISLLISVVVGILSVIFSLGGYSLYYYSFPFVWPAVLIGIMVLLSVNFEQTAVDPAKTQHGLLLVFFLLGIFLNQDVEILMQAKDRIVVDKNIQVGLMNSELVSSLEMTKYKNLQNSVPVGAIILARLDRNFIFDFKRNPVYINDLPGGSSFPPGLPLRQGGEKLSEYLLAHEVRYVAYSYGNEANFSSATAGSMLRPHVNPLFRMGTQNAFDFQSTLMALAQVRKKIYDDGKHLVLDLATKSQ